ncbi:MAG: hypothetical protein GXY19_09370 [Phycisphaerae bacterium]|nr:hypothetical protein [Phycisphaerae bacterium]
MSTVPRQIVLDKSAFDGTKIDALRDFAKLHPLLVSEVLLYESGTSQRFKDRQLLSRCRDLLLAGASYCSRTEDLIRWEGQHSRPFPRLLADSRRTCGIRLGPARSDHAFTDEEIAAEQRVGFEYAKAFLLDPVRDLLGMAKTRRSDVPDFRGLPKDISARLAAFAATVDHVSFRKLALTQMPRNWVEDEEKFCLSSEWMAWQFFRLLDIIQREYLYLHQVGGSLREKRAEHDYQDIGYVLLLSRADAIITRDRQLVEPLVRVAFPEKDVFSSLEEVPESYRCDWMGD